MDRRRSGRIIGLGLVGAALALSATGLGATAAAPVRPAAAAAASGSPAPSALVRRTFRPVADAYVSAWEPARNYGAASRLRIDGDPRRRAYLRFDVGGFDGRVVRATLRLYATSTSRRPFAVFPVRGGSWDERTVSEQTAPSLAGAALDRSGRVVAARWVSVDVTGLVRRDGAVSMALGTSSSTAVALASRESGAPPVLVVEFAGAARSAPAAAPAISPAAGTTPDPTSAPAPSQAPASAAPSNPADGAPDSMSAPAPSETPAPAPSPTPAPAPTPTPTPPPSADPVIAAAGDIACDPSDGNFSGKSIGTCQMKATSDLLVNNGLAGVLTLGDNQYESNTYANYLQSFDPTWGRVKSMIHPAIGNHEYLTSGAAGYFQYFGAAAGSASKGYYSFDIGAWHLIALNSNCSQVGGCGAGSPQETWLRADLAAHPAACTLAYWHHPRFSSGEHGSTTSVTPLVKDLYDAGAEVILSGHDHDYERFAPQTSSGTADAARGIRQFVIGTGGKNHYGFGTPLANSEVRNDTTYGVLKLTLHPAGYDWQFAPQSGGTFSDAGSAACH